MGKKQPFVPKHKKLEIVFDPDARKEYLTGFSKRKTERRKFGLAMQKVKDRKAMLAVRQQVREAKKEALPDVELPKPVEEVVAPVETIEFRDGFTTERFGESVMVTTYLGIPPADDSSDDDEDEEERSKRRVVDHEQLAAGSVERFKKIVSGELGRRKKKTKENRSGSFKPRKGADKDEAKGKKKRKK